MSGRRTALVLGAILLGALALRLWHIGHGLPFAYNADEAEHFVPKAIEMFRGGLDPGYYENPSALTYLFYALFKLRFTAGFPFGGGRGLVRELRRRPRGRVPHRARRRRADRHARRAGSPTGRARATSSAASGSSPRR